MIPRVALRLTYQMFSKFLGRLAGYRALRS